MRTRILRIALSIYITFGVSSAPGNGWCLICEALQGSGGEMVIDLPEKKYLITIILTDLHFLIDSLKDIH